MTQTTVRQYESNLDHLRAEVALLDLRLLEKVQRLRQRTTGRLQDEFRGLLVSEEQIDSILSGLIPDRVEAEPNHSPLLPLMQRWEEEAASRKRQSLSRGGLLRLERLRDFFKLSDFDIGVVIICLAPELDLKYETIYSYLQDDVGKKRPTVNLALTLLCSTLPEQVKQRQSLIFPAPLVKEALVHLPEDPYDKDSSFLARFMRLDQRIANYLLDSDAIDSRLQPLARLIRPTTSWEQVVLPAETKARLEGLSEQLQKPFSGGSGIVLQLVGPEGSGKKTVAQALCSSLAKSLLIVDTAGLLASDSPGSNLVHLAFREACLQDAVLCWDNFQYLLGDDSQQRAVRASLNHAITGRPGLTILAGQVPWRPEEGLEEQILLTVELPLPDFSGRKRLWKSYLNGHQGRLTEEEFGLLASKFRFSGGQVRRVVTTARDLARWRSWDAAEITAEDLHLASRWHSSQRLALLAQKIQPRYAWNDIVLPPDQKAQLREICGYFRNMPLVYEQWGFQSKASLGKGLNILFAGPSGTGKTMSAEIMAGELGLDLYKIDLSTVVSKYIGETEKNLDRIFREAQDSNAILFFDEADALFGKRSEVRDSHDRYANIEISYLLQKMEEYMGIVILATNFRKNIDDAFVRRLHFAVEFPFPEEEYRLQIWQRVFPRQAPLEASVDLPFLARQFKVAGGNIKNIAVTAAFLAAQQGTSIGMEQVMWATKREYQKMGKLLVEGDFGRYFDLVRG